MEVDISQTEVPPVKNEPLVIRIYLISKLTTTMLPNLTHNPSERRSLNRGKAPLKKASKE